MNSIDLLDALKKAMKLPSDYALAKHWGIDHSLMSKYRNGKVELGDELALRVADELGLDRGQVLAALAAARAARQGKPEVARAWQRVARRAVGCLAAAIGVGVGSPVPPASAAPASSPAAVQVEGVHIMSNRRRRWWGSIPAWAF